MLCESRFIAALLAICSVLLAPSLSFALETEYAQTGRFISVPVGPSVGQRNPLESLITVTFPANIVTIGDAVEHLLSRTGYQLATPVQLDLATRSLLKLPLPEVQRRIGPIRVKEAMAMLVGESFQVLVDPVHRLVGFKLIEGNKSPNLTQPFDSLKNNDVAAISRPATKSVQADSDFILFNF